MGQTQRRSPYRWDTLVNEVSDDVDAGTATVALLNSDTGGHETCADSPTLETANEVSARGSRRPP